MKEKFAIKVIWGSDKCREVEEMKKEKILQIPDDGYEVITYEFETQGELEAFVKGVSESNGWRVYNIIEI